MSELDAAVARGNNLEEDCPLCLEPLPPFWDRSRRSTALCCGKCMCLDCQNKQVAHLQRARAGGTWGDEEEQLDKYCPLCRTEKPTAGAAGIMMLDRFEKRQLLLQL